MLFPATTLAGTATPEEAYGSTAVSMIYTPTYTIPSDLPYDPNFRMNISGVVQNSDGSPFSPGFIELHSTVKRTMVDDGGTFTITGAEQGVHSLYALDRTNAVQGTLNFRIDRTNTVESTALFTLPDGTTEVLINGRVIALYLTLSLDGQGNLILVNAREIDGSQGAGTTGSQEAFLNPRTGLLSDRASVYGALLLLGILSIGMGWRFRKIK